MLAFNPPPIFGLGNAGGFELYVQNRGEGGPKRLAEVHASSCSPTAHRSRARQRAVAVASASAAAVRRRRPRRRRNRWACRIDDVFHHAGGDARHLLRQRLQQVRPHLAGADVGRAGLSRKRRTTSARSTCAGSGRQPWCRSRRWPASSTRSGPETLDRFNNCPAVKIFGQRGAGRQLRAGNRRWSSTIASQMLPPELQLRLERRLVPGKALQRHLGDCARVWRCVMVFLILAAQYEKWSLPLAVLLALPFGTFGALAAVWLRGTQQRRLLPDRPGDAARPGGEERDPDRRIRPAQERRRLCPPRPRPWKRRACASGRS